MKNGINVNRPVAKSDCLSKTRHQSVDYAILFGIKKINLTKYRRRN